MRVYGSAPMDRWCEQRMWDELGLETGGAELLSCGTALVLCVVPALFPPRRWTQALCALQAMLFLLGVGTFVYHWVPHDEDHINAFDWFPMILTCALLGYMLVRGSLEGYWDSTLFFVGLFAWALGLMVAMNLYDYAWLNAVLVVPPVLLLLGFLDYRQAAAVWFWLAISLVLWLANHFGCEAWTPLAALHSVYHVTMALALWEAGKVAEA